MKYKYLAAAMAFVGMGLFSSCVDEFADLNQKPSDITKPNIRYLFTQCASTFQPGDYYQWFYGFDFLSTWAQATVPAGGNGLKLNTMTITSTGCGYRVNEVLRYTNEIRYQISLMSEEDKAKYEYIQYLCNPLLVFLGLQDSDMYGSRQYSEAEMARYGGTLTPKFDTQAELYDIWLRELDETINYLTTKKPTDVLAAQDFIYRGKLDKWLKLANTLKLRIAARLINEDRTRALSIVNEAAKSSAGFLSSLDDDFVYNKGKKDNNWNNNFTVGVGREVLINFMKDNRDPRLFYMFQKNDYNSNVVQGFFDQNRALPSYVEKNVEFEIQNGKKIFKNWKAPGEPWVRYYGAPCQVELNKNKDYDEYFDPNGELFCLYDDKNVKKTYSPLSYRNQETIKGMLTYTYPDVPGVSPEQDKEPYGWYGLYFSSGEANLLLAEFKLLGATLPNSAEEYYRKGVELSVRGYDAVAALNHIPYYDITYKNDRFDQSIKLTESQITDMLSHEVYKLTGNVKSDLEKVYIQQYIHYLMAPIDMYVTMLRSGVPMKNSQLLPYEQFEPTLGDNYIIPRRYPVALPDLSDILYNIIKEAYQAQGFTADGDSYLSPSTLSKERVWVDKKNPDFGAGPKLN